MTSKKELQKQIDELKKQQPTFRYDFIQKLEWPYGLCVRPAEIPLQKLLELILDHLGLEVKETPAREVEIVLRARRKE